MRNRAVNNNADFSTTRNSLQGLLNELETIIAQIEVENGVDNAYEKRMNVMQIILDKFPPIYTHFERLRRLIMLSNGTVSVAQIDEFERHIKRLSARLIQLIVRYSNQIRPDLGAPNESITPPENLVQNYFRLKHYLYNELEDLANVVANRITESYAALFSFESSILESLESYARDMNEFLITKLEEYFYLDKEIKSLLISMREFLLSQNDEQFFHLVTIYEYHRSRFAQSVVLYKKVDDSMRNLLPKLDEYRKMAVTTNDVVSQIPVDDVPTMFSTIQNNVAPFIDSCAQERNELNQFLEKDFSVINDFLQIDDTLIDVDNRCWSLMELIVDSSVEEGQYSSKLTSLENQLTPEDNTRSAIEELKQRLSENRNEMESATTSGLSKLREIKRSLTLKQAYTPIPGDFNILKLYEEIMQILYEEKFELEEAITKVIGSPELRLDGVDLNVILANTEQGDVQSKRERLDSALKRIIEPRDALNADNSELSRNIRLIGRLSTRDTDIETVNAIIEGGQLVLERLDQYITALNPPAPEH
jgi:hypothetical protein